MLHWGNKNRLFFKLVFQLINQQEKTVWEAGNPFSPQWFHAKNRQPLLSEPSTLGKDSGDKIKKKYK